MTTEVLIFTSVARRLEAGTYRPTFKALPPPPPAPTFKWAPVVGTILCGVGIALAFLVS